MAIAASSREQDAPYRYTPLRTDGNWIRILYLDPAKEPNHYISARLKHVNLDLNTRPRVRSGTLAPPGPVHDQQYRPKYEALSWCWSDKVSYQPISIRNGDDADERWKTLNVPASLAAALRALRHKDKTRLLWTDGICIDMPNKEEQADQVAKMDIIYKKSDNVCVWLEQDLGQAHVHDCTLDDLKKFICSELFQLEKFDKIINSDDYARKWVGLVRLMTKKWFSRRWIIQEIVLARRASIHCGHISIGWRQFEHAVSLFVKAESAGHRMSKMLSKEERLNYKKDILWDIDRMGACSLVEITTANFRRSSRGISEPASTLETLMAKLAMFESSVPVDTIYALLGIATDTRAETKATSIHIPDLIKLHAYTNHRGLDLQQQRAMVLRTLKVVRMLAAGRRSKPYTVTYTKPPVQVYKDFVEFCIYRSRSLDVLLRPWAPKPETETDNNPMVSTEANLFETMFGLPTEDEPGSPLSSSEETRPSDEWLHDMGLAFENEGLDGVGPSSSPNIDELSPRKRSSGQINGGSVSVGSGAEKNTDYPSKRARTAAFPNALAQDQVATTQTQYNRSGSSEMPTWIADRSQIPFTLSVSLDESMKSMERRYADPLVGTPDTRYYRASGTQPVRMTAVQFRSRSDNDHSLFVQGFVLFEVSESEQHADLSNIPLEWFEFAGQDQASQGRLFRTMVADRGPKGTPTPTYFVSAFHEAFKDRQTTLEIKDAIHVSNSFMEEFYERVRQVTFNRKLIKTAVPSRSGRQQANEKEHEAEEQPRLGLGPKTVRHRHDGKSGSGDLVCILYGMSVPVVLKKHGKTAEEKEMDHRAQQDQLPDAFRKAVRTIETHWSFYLALKDAVIALTRRHWSRYEGERTQGLLPEWRKSIRRKFPRFWLAQVDKEYVDKRDGRVREPLNVPIVGKQKPMRLKPTLSELEKDGLWSEMSEEWSRWLSDPQNQVYVEIYKCRPYDAVVATPDDYYTIVGECYIDEMMDGQALDYKKKFQIEDQIFELR